jgi:hypothetical protein
MRLKDIGNQQEVVPQLVESLFDSQNVGLDGHAGSAIPGLLRLHRENRFV